MSEHRALVGPASLIASITVVSRVAGMFRETRIAALLGADDANDAFIAAYRIPNMLRRLVGEGAVSAAFVPTFSKYLQGEGRDQAFRLANAVLTLLTLGLAVVVVIGVVFSEWLVPLLVAGFRDTPGKMELTAELNRIMFPYILLVSASAMAMGILNSLGRFAAPAFAPVLLNLAIIAFSYATGAFATPERALAVGVIVGGVAQIAVQVPQMLSGGWRFRPALDWRHPGVRKVLALMGPVAVGVGVVNVNVVVGTLFASVIGEGAVSWLHFSDRVMELVLGGYAIAIATVIVPMMSRQADARRMEEMKRTLNFAMRLVLFITVPATIGLIVLRVPIIQVLFERDEFDASDTSMTAYALLFYAIGLSAFALVKIVAPAFYSMQDTKTPVWIAFFAMLLNIVFNAVFLGPLQVGGPALAASMAGVFNAIALVVVFRRREGALGIRAVGSSMIRFLAASAALGLAAHWLIHRPGFYFDEPFSQRAMALALTIGLATAVYFGVAALLGAREIGELRDVLRPGGGRAR